MATPLVAGCAAVVREYLRTQGQQRPSAALVKAMLINGAGDIQGQYNPSEAGGLPNLSEGFGRVNLAATVGPHPAGRRLTFQEENGVLDTGDTESTTVTITSSGASFKATLVWSDPPGEGLQNDLDLIVQAANGEERHGNVPAASLAFDRANNVEQVVWENVPPGNVQVAVRAHRITLHPQSYALVVRVDHDGNVPGTGDVGLSIANVELTQSGVNELTAAVSFQLTGEDADGASNAHTPFRIQLALLDLGSADSQTVASEEATLQPGILAYRRPLRFPIPSPGRYRLHSRVILVLADGERTADFDGPSFRVIA
jgi:hypothetical protein